MTEPLSESDRRRNYAYVYGVVRAGFGVPDRLIGVAGAPVGTVAEGSLAALVSAVPAVDFEEAALRAHLEDLRRLERVARAHRGVVDTVAAGTCVLPLRLATVYRDERGVRRALASRFEDFASALARLNGRFEWGVKAYTDEGEAPAPVPAAGAGAGIGPGSPAPAADSGRDFLRRRLAHRRAEEESQRHAAAFAHTVHDALDRFAEHSTLHRPQDSRLSAAPGHNILNGAYLVPREEAGAFAGLVGELAERAPGVRLELTGPWAPYSFANPAAPEDERASAHTAREAPRRPETPGPA